MHSASARLFVCGVLGTLLSAWNHAVEADTLLTAGIAPQPVAAALSEFAHQTGLQLLYVSQVAQARASKGASAGLSAGISPSNTMRIAWSTGNSVPSM